jgi:adenine-specific DNA-methyltransferase
MATSKKENGIVYTPDQLGTFISERMIFIAGKSRAKRLDILEPAIGDGDLISSLLTILDTKETSIHVTAFDTDSDALGNALKKLSERFPAVSFDFRHEDFISFALSQTEPTFDLVIANPPYVRINYLQKDVVEKARSLLGLDGKIDLYQMFLLLFSRVTKQGGTIGVVTSNKFLYNKTGISLRKKLLDYYAIKEIYDFGDTKIFQDAAVLPCVMIMKNEMVFSEPVSFTTIYSSNPVEEKETNTIFEAIKKKQSSVIKDGEQFNISYGLLNPGETAWSLENDEVSGFLKSVEKNTRGHFEDIAKIRVGIKTTADNVFISDDWDRLGKEKPELLFPLITHRMAGQFVGKKQDQFQVLYPYDTSEEKCVPVNLKDFPKTGAYLEKNRVQLEGRKYIAESKKEWFEIWVAHSPRAWRKTKIVFRDISEKPCFWIGPKNTIVNGDCYWFDFKDGVTEEQIYLCLAIANSTFIEKYYDSVFNNKLYSGRRRFMSQYVEQFPLIGQDNPYYSRIIELTEKICKHGPKDNEKKELDDLVFMAFVEKVDR